MSSPYDKLVLSPGANPIVPPALKGADRENVFTICNVRDIVALKTFLDKPETKHVFRGRRRLYRYRGCGKIWQLAGKDVTLAELSGQILQPFDEDMVQILHKELDDHGVKLLLHTRTCRRSRSRA